MNQEKETMQAISSAGEYIAPRVEVVEVKARRVVCGSYETTSDTEVSDYD